VNAGDPSFEALLEFLKHSRTIDFTGYKRTSLERRFRRRLTQVGCASFGDYLDYLEVHPDEYAALFDTLLINVTEFFRDPPAWEYLRDDVLPPLLEAKEADAPVRVWSAGCASGQEAYSIAILLAEALGDEAYRERVKIYATDIDEDALNTARQALYSEHELESVPSDLRERYFVPVDGRFAFRKDLRRAIIFGRNNLVQDSPISRLDLLICRNTLMYLTAETQARILRHFHFALDPAGTLMLGKSEMMVSHRDLFEARDLKKRVFARRALGASSAARGGAVPDADAVLVLPADERAARVAFEVGSTPQIIVTRTGALAFANVAARALFHIAVEDIGRPFHDLELSYRPAELRRPIEQALRERRRIAVGETRFAPEEGDERRLDITVVPLLSDDAAPLGASVSFEDVTRFSVLQREIESHRHELEQAYEELQSTIDELETTNEELQSANEELQTTNEELQSTNEELETMNEELHSTNEELETINDELRERTGEVNELNDFLEAIVTSLGIGVVVVDPTGRVQIWNRSAEEQWGVRQDEAVAHNFLGLDLGLPTEQVAPALRAVLAGTSDSERLELEAVNRRGRAIVCSTSVLPLRSAHRDGDGDGDGRIRGAIVLMEDSPADGEE
jgi:two-component system, chemotaxis family, CheB/CheR fusion protein